MELEAFIRQFVARRCPVIPVILPTCKTPPKLPVFLSAMTWVDFRTSTPDPLERLVWGITGERADGYNVTDSSAEWRFLAGKK
jgi:hypothetical protein